MKSFYREDGKRSLCRISIAFAQLILIRRPKTQYTRFMEQGELRSETDAVRIVYAPDYDVDLIMLRIYLISLLSMLTTSSILFRFIPKAWMALVLVLPLIVILYPACVMLSLAIAEKRSKVRFERVGLDS